jgi:pyruvate formate lyase activating enzyme
MDIKHSLDKLKDVISVEFNKKEIEKSINLILNSEVDYEFRTTVVKTLHNL